MEEAFQLMADHMVANTDSLRWAPPAALPPWACPPCLPLAAVLVSLPAPRGLCCVHRPLCSSIGAPGPCFPLDLALPQLHPHAWHVAHATALPCMQVVTWRLQLQAQAVLQADMLQDAWRCTRQCLGPAQHAESPAPLTLPA